MGRDGVVTNASLHSSNDSGFANEHPPPQPDVDYSDEETVSRVPIRFVYKKKIIIFLLNHCNKMIKSSSKFNDFYYSVTLD